LHNVHDKLCDVLLFVNSLKDAGAARVTISPWRTSARNQRELYGSRPSIFLKGGYCTVRKRQPVSLTLSDHLFNLAYQELIDLPGIIDLAAAFEKLPSDLLRFRK
jgi:hypothetical protein